MFRQLYILTIYGDTVCPSVFIYCGMYMFMNLGYIEVRQRCEGHFQDAMGGTSQSKR